MSDVQRAQSSAINQACNQSLNWHLAPSEEYANEVHVTENDHDAVLTFWRRSSGARRSHVRTITVPKGLLPLLTVAPKKGAKR